MIIRKIRLTEYEYQPPINFVAGATEPDIQFQLTDYTIPAGAEARAYVQRFDGTFEYTVATIDGNNVTVEPTSSMFSVRGEGAIQITLYAGDEVLKNFSVPVFVHADLADENAEQGSDVTGVFRAAEEEALADFQEQAEEIAEEVKESIPEDYTELTEEVSELNERLEDKADAIEVESEQGFNHTGSIRKVTFIGNAYAFKTARYANRKNLLPTLNGSKSTGGMDYTFVDNFIVYNGTPLSTGTFSVGYVLDVDIPAGDYVLYCEPHGTTTASPGRAMPVVATYADDTTETFTTPSVLNDDVSLNITFAKAVKKIELKTGLRSGTYTNYTLWYGLYERNVTITDTEETVASGSTYTAEIESTDVVNTMQHSSIVSEVVDTKEYIDNHMPVIDFDEEVYSRQYYVSPEMFGAKGDEVTDDSQAINDAISYGLTNGCAVRGFGKYKATQTIEITGANNDVYIKSLSYTGSGIAVKITGSRNKLSFGKIISSGKGIAFETSTGVYVENCMVEGVYLYATDHGLYFYNADGSDDDGRSYVIAGHYINIRNIRSVNGRVFHSTTSVAETTCFFGSCRNGSGFAFYLYEGGVNIATANLESCYAGFLVQRGVFWLGHVRTGELVNQMRSDAEDPDKGMLFKANADGTGYILFYSDINIHDYIAIDVSGRRTTPPASDNNWEYVVRLGKCRRYYNYNYIPEGTTGHTGNMIVYGDIVVYGNRKAFIPFQKTAMTISSDIHLDDMQQLPPTRFNAGANDVKIYLGDSYCPYGIDRFIVDQTEYTCDIYDADENLIWDGSDYGTGVFDVQIMQVNPPHVVSSVWGWVIGQPLTLYVSKLNEVTITT